MTEDLGETSDTPTRLQQLRRSGRASDRLLAWGGRGRGDRRLEADPMEHNAANAALTYTHTQKKVLHMNFKRSCPSVTKNSRLLLRRRRNNTLRFSPCAKKKNFCSFTLFQQQIFLRLINNVVVGVAVVVVATQQDLIWVTQRDARV